MESPFDFQLDFENMPSFPIIETLQSAEHQGINPWIETEHKGNKVYVCTDCNRAFKYQSQANRHSAVHSKDRIYPCTFRGCNKSFKRADVLQTHMRFHADNLPYICDEPGCNQKFASKPALKCHQVKHANNSLVKRHVTDWGYSFLHASQRTEHIKEIHIGELPPAISTSQEEEGLPIDPETEKAFQQLLNAPYNPNEWRMLLMAERQKPRGKKGFVGCRQFMNYIINQLRILKEKARSGNQNTIQVNNDDIIGLINQNSFSEFASFTEQFGSDELKFLECLKEGSDNDL